MSIGEDLAQARRRAGLTVAQVSAKTRIREAVICGIERDDCSLCGGDFYARGHIRAIARAVGADPGPLLAAYDAASRPPPAPTAELFGPVTPLKAGRRRRAAWPVALVLAAATLGFAGYQVIAGLLHQGRAGPVAPAAGQAPPTSAPPAPTAASTATVPVVAPTPDMPGPWAVVRAYYRDVRSRNYRRAWTLINSGAVTGQTYQQFVAGYACTGAVHLTKLSQSGRQVIFHLAAVDGCTRQTQYYTGTATVHHGKIVAAGIRPGR